MSVRSDEQRLDVGTVVELFALDLEGAGGGAVLRFTPGPWGGGPAVYKGLSHQPCPIRVTGLRSGGSGAPARPRLELSRLDATVAAALAGGDDWRGAKLTRLRTLERHLDGAEDPDPDRHWPPESWRVDRLLERTAATVAWALAVPFDVGRRQLPGRQMLAAVCNWRYRAWDPDANGGAGAWDYSAAECPYAGIAPAAKDGPFFGRDDEEIAGVGGAAPDPAKDVCSRRVSGCKARFPGQPLPFGGFIGLGRVVRR